MREPSRNDIIVRRAIDEWLYDVNFNQCNEELGELIVAINHYRRGRINEMPLIEEMADVSLILDLLKTIIAKDTHCTAEIVDAAMLKIKQNKIDRLERRLDGIE